MKSHCDKHKEYTIGNDYFSSCSVHKPHANPDCINCEVTVRGSDHCPDCQRVLAETWAGLFGLNHRTKYINKDSRWAYSDSGFTFCYNLELVNKILSPDGMLKAWEFAESKGWSSCNSSGVFSFLLPVLDGDNKSTKIYSFKKYGKVPAIMLAAWEAVNYG